MTETKSPREIVLERLEDQIGWYDRKSQSAQRWYKHFKIISMVSAALIPFLSAYSLTTASMPDPLKLAVGALGIIVTICEGLQQLNQYHQNWITYRATCEALRHEKFAYLASVGEYGTATNAVALLADRIESLISTEHTTWMKTQQVTDKNAPPGAGAGAGAGSGGRERAG